MRRTKHCKTCDTEELKFDADARWNPETEVFDMVDVPTVDQAYCTVCEDSVFVTDKTDGVPDEAS